MLRRSQQQAHQKMPFGNGRTSSNTEKLVNRGGFPLSKRYLDQKNHKLYSEERQGPALILRSSEQRCIILTLATVELNAWKLLVPFSEACVNGDGHELSPPLSFIVQVDLSKEQKANSSECPGSAKSCSSSGENVLGISPNNSKRSKSLKNSSSTSLPSPILPNNFSGLDGDGWDVLVSNTPKVDKPVKRFSRKKGKKKGKHYKRSMHKKVFPVSETQYEESICDISVSESPVSSETTCTLNNMSVNIPSPTLAVKDITVEQDESKFKDNDYTNSLVTPLTSYSCEIDESEPIAVFSQRPADEELSCNQLGMNEGSNHLAIKSTSILCTERTRFTSDELVGIHYDISSTIVFHQDNAPMEDTLLDNRKIKISENCSDNVESMDDDGPNHSEGGIALDTRNSDISFRSIPDDSCDRKCEMSTNCHSTNHYRSKDIVDTDHCTDRAQCSSEASSSNDFQPVIYRKKGRLTKKLSQSFNGIHRFGTTNTHDWTTRDGNHSIWQRVQKKNTEECIHETKKADLVSRHIDISAEGSEAKTRSDSVVAFEKNRNGNLRTYTCLEMADQTAQIDLIKASSSKVDSSEIISKGIDGRYNVPDKFERKSSSASKHGNHYAMKGSHPDKTTMDRPKIHAQQKELGSSLQVTHHQCIGSGLSPSGSNVFQSVVVMPTNKADCQSGQHHRTQNNVEEDAAVENICSIVCHSLSEDEEKLVSPFAVASNSWDPSHIKVQSDSGRNMQEDICLFTDSEGSKYMKSESESSHADNNKLVSTVLQNLVAVGKKDPLDFSTSPTGNLTTAVNESAPDSSNSKNEVELLSSNSLQSLETNGLTCLSPCSEDTRCPTTEADDLTKCHHHTHGEFGGVLAVSDHCVTHEVKNQLLSGFESDLIQIVEAVGDSYKVQTASHGVHLVTGSPVAEFERFLYSASPILDQTYCTRNCTTCSTDQPMGDSLCRHQIPKITLGSLWQWYEKHGSYGMEVKAEDCYDSKRSRNGRFEFRAYFVPYLSAVQLFGWSRNSVCANGDPHEVVMEDCGVGKTSKISSYSSPFPVLSLPLSQPRNEEDVCLLTPTKGKVCNKSVRSRQLDDEELLFEYFESDQPQQRRPLFEKIKELVRGNTSSNCQIFGDPLKLECLNLHDLHPASWFSVAWYPIYRIPDGNFRAAFLTYHSLGHFVRATSTTHDSIVSPVVGLQSYNAKGECWFQARDLKSKVAETEDATAFDHSKILNERVRTLERAASVMARASVRKGSLRCVNRQPDYEFFVSRRQ